MVTTDRKDFNKNKQFVNASPNNNPMPSSDKVLAFFTSNVYNQEPITYKHSYNLFVPIITQQNTSLTYANRK